MMASMIITLLLIAIVTIYTIAFIRNIINR